MKALCLRILGAALMATAAGVMSPAQAPLRPLAPSPTSIRVHGHWTIVVRNPDGSIASRREFENSLVLGGADLLPALLGGTVTPGQWLILLSNDQGTAGPCGQPAILGAFDMSGEPLQLGSPCTIAESSLLCQNSSCSPTLTAKVQILGVTTSVPSEPILGLQLSGFATAQQTGTITNVATELVLCGMQTGTVVTGLGGASTVSPQTCASGAAMPTGAAVAFGLQPISGTPVVGSIFTSAANLPASAPAGQPAQIQVKAQQIVQVTVVITFS